MSGINIPGVSVPADDTVLLRVYPEENGYHFVERIDGIDQDFLGSYWAVPVPTHGDLIDRERLIDIAHHLMNTAKNDDIANGVKWLWQYIIEAPTIIPAEEE